jgi:Na+/H+ antiporter NhaA
LPLHGLMALLASTRALKAFISALAVSDDLGATILVHFFMATAFISTHLL